VIDGGESGHAAGRATTVERQPAFDRAGGETAEAGRNARNRRWYRGQGRHQIPGVEPDGLLPEEAGGGAERRSRGDLGKLREGAWLPAAGLVKIWTISRFVRVILAQGPC
jgi:hypothetical protein